LVDSFIKGAEEAGHTCEIIDVCTPMFIRVSGAFSAGMKVPASRRTTLR
jgi:hypothetical protein